MHTKETREYEKLCTPVFALLFRQDVRALITPDDPVQLGSPPTPMGSGALLKLICVRRVHVSSLVLLLLGHGIL